MTERWGEREKESETFRIWTGDHVKKQNKNKNKERFL